MYLRIDLQTFADILHQTFLVICIINGKIVVKSQPVYISSQNTHTA